MSKRGEPWTPEEHDRLLESLRKGKTFDQLAREHERSVKAVKWRFGTHCGRMRSKKTIDQLAREFHVDATAIEEILSDMNSSPQQNQSLHNTTTSSMSRTPPAIDHTAHQKMDEMNERLQRHSRILKKMADDQKILLAEIRELRKSATQSKSL